MTRQQYYPRADPNVQNFYAAYPALFAPSRRMADVNTLVLHTTEGGSWPGYSAGSMTPTFTYDPRSHQMRQHIPVNMAARALVDAGIGTNRLNVAQIEIIGYAAQGGPLDAQAIQDLAALVAWLNAEWSVPITAPYPFTVPAHRMSAAEYGACRGVIGHGHVYGNSHWDPGAMNVPAILAAAHSSSGPGGIVSGTVHIPTAPTFPTTTTEDDDMRDIIAAAYRTYLGREGGNAELDGWTLSTVKQGKTAAQILPQISDSAEGRAYATTSSYKTYLGRAPSAGDLAFWSKQGGFDAIVAGISSSTEAKNRKV